MKNVIDNGFSLNEFSVLRSNNPKEKLNFFLLKLVESGGAAGTKFSFESDNSASQSIAENFGFRNPEEMLAYLQALGRNGLVDLSQVTRHGKGHFIVSYTLTYEGVLYASELKEEGINSNWCFVAMSFDPEDRSIYEDGIKPALIETNFVPYIVSDQHLESEQTINDGIIAGIKRSRFMVADFTKHKKGVYFEAGYGLGRGLKVIYTCREDHFKDAHFDTNHYAHLIYSSPEDLKVKLINKIGAWIKD